jgi:uncharacterized membrane protein YqjE
MIDRLSLAATLAVRHAGAYADLLASDLDASSRALRGRLIAAGILGFATLVAVSLACVWVLAATWDTPQRYWALGGLLALFVIIALVSFLRIRSISAAAPPMLAQISREWAKDRRMLEDLLRRDKEQVSDQR